MCPAAKRKSCWLNGATRWALLMLALLPATLFAGLGLSGEATVPKRVLIIESFGRDVAPFNAITPAFKKELLRTFPGRVEFHEAGLESAGKNKAEEAFTSYLKELYATRRPDLVMPVGGAAAQFWERQRAALFPETPVVIAGIENRVLRSLNLSSNDAVVAVQFDPVAATEIIPRLFPSTTNIGVVLGNSALEQFWVTTAQRELSNRSPSPHITWFNDLPFAEMCRRAAAMPEGSALAFGMLVIDKEGVAYQQTTALDQICRAANAPVFGLFEEQLGHGIVGGVLYSSEELGRQAGKVAARVLGGERPGDIGTTVVSAGKPVFDWRELKRWDVSERNLPEGSVVRFRQPSTWERYRWYILGALGVMLLQTVTILGLVAQRARRRRAEASLRESRQFMELAAAAGDLGLWVGNAAGGVLWVNRSMRLMFGWAEQTDVSWDNILRGLHPDDRGRAEDSLQHAIGKGGTFEFEGRVLREDGQEFWIVARGLATLDGHGKLERTQGIFLDITARHLAEMEAQRYRNELLHIGRVHVLGQLSCALAHELNQPLGAILSNAEAAELLLNQGTSTTAELSQILGDIRNDNQRASDVVNRMRALLRRHDLELSCLAPGDLIRDCIVLTRPNAIERKMTVDWEVHPGTPCVRGDRIHLGQVLLNLVVNAIDSMAAGPVDRRRLRITAKRGEHAMVEFQVRDTGCGIPVDQSEHIFDLFHTTKAQGLGVGLAISRTIVEAHGGRIWAENNPEGGATLYFTLSRHEPEVIDPGTPATVRNRFKP